ncbi:hypothetical protein ABZZ79_38895 [Streptomyces sp. NPDC006458]
MPLMQPYAALAGAYKAELPIGLARKAGGDALVLDKAVVRVRWS